MAESPPDWRPLHEAARKARYFADVAMACVDRPNPELLARARSDLDEALADLPREQTT